MVSDYPSIDNETFTADDRGDYTEWLADCAAALSDAGYDDISEQFWNCSGPDACFRVNHKTPVNDDSARAVYVCGEHPDHEAKVVRFTCHLRICPHCAKRESARLLQRYVPAVQDAVAANKKRNYRLRKIVLTTDIDLRADDASIEFRRLANCIAPFFDELLSKNWRKSQGVIVAAEFGPQGHKLHFHILHFGEWISNRSEDGYPLASAWERISGIPGAVARVYGVKQDAIMDEVVEILKYTTKFWSTDEHGNVKRLEPELMPKLYEVLTGKRRVRSYGIFYRVPDNVTPPSCSCCDAELVRWSVSEWNIFVKTGWTPDEQVLHLGSDIGNNFCISAEIEIKQHPPPHKQELLL